MDPIVFEILGSLLVAGMAYLTVFHRPGRSPPQTMPMLAVRKTRSVPHRQRSVKSTKARTRVAGQKSRKQPKMKPIEPTVESPQGTSQVISTTANLSACPSCGLQAPEKLLAEHFLGSPSHQNGPPKVQVTDEKQVAAYVKTEQDDSNQSVRNLMQILVPPRAFGRRHAHRSVSPFPTVVQDIEPYRRHYQ